MQHLTSSRASPALSHQSRLSYPEVRCRKVSFFHLALSDDISTAYEEYDYPWFDLYDELLPELQPTGRFRNLQSVRQLDTSSASASPSCSSDLPDPTDPPHCATHSYSQCSCVFRPCGHYGCEGCVEQVTMGSNECPVCGRAVARMVGFQKPIPQVNVGAGSEGDWQSIEEKIEGVPVHAKFEAASVITLVLHEDNVSCLSGTTL